jgi:flagellar basal body L-ring protein FlgH
MLTATTTTGTATATSASSTTAFSTTTSGGTVTVSQTDTFIIFLTKIIQVLLKFANEVLKLLGTRTVAMPKGQKIIRVIITRK